MAFKYPECAECDFHNREPAICEECVDADEFEPSDAALASIPIIPLRKAA